MLTLRVGENFECTCTRRRSRESVLGAFAEACVLEDEIQLDVVWPGVTSRSEEPENGTSNFAVTARRYADRDQ